MSAFTAKGALVTGGTSGIGRAAAVASAKEGAHSVLGVTTSAALDYAKTKPRINAVCPGLIAMDMLAGMTGGWEAMEKASAEMQPIGRAGTPEEIASAVIWLCSSGASPTTGHHPVLDGGMTAAA